MTAADETPAQPTKGERLLAEMGIPLPGRGKGQYLFSTAMIPPAADRIPDPPPPGLTAAPAPDGNAGGAGDEVYEAAAEAYDRRDDPACLERPRAPSVLASHPPFRAAIDAAWAILRESIGHRAILDAHAERDEMAEDLAEAREQVAALESYRQLAREASDGYHAGAAKLIEERDQLRQHILDIDAHATPYGDLPEDPGDVGVYLLSAGALHRALGKIGHTAPNCQAEAQLAEAILERDEARAKTDGGEWTTSYGHYDRNMLWWDEDCGTPNTLQRRVWYGPPTPIEPVTDGGGAG